MNTRSHLKVLVVDDDPISLEVARERLEREGHEVQTRDRALGTSRVILAFQPDCVLLDVMMPGITGDELATLLRSQGRLSHVAIVLHSAKDPDELSDLIVRTGAIGAIHKTSDDEEFLREFRRITHELAGRRSA